MTKKIAVAGLGTVGLSTIKGLIKNKSIINERTSNDFEFVAVSARSNKDRGVDLSMCEFFDNPVAMAENTDSDIFIELMGGTDDVILNYVKTVLKKGKILITANKAMLASYGEELSELAEANNAHILFEASIGGGIPCVKTLREGMSGNKINAIYGILNGTCNYILTTVKDTGRQFDDVLVEAQKLGYAEADPTFDVEGYDAGQKLALMASIGFGIKVPYDEMYFEGIMNFISNDDVKNADELGFTPRLIGTAKPMNDGYLVYMVPSLVRKEGTMGSIGGVINGCIINGDMVGDVVNIGAGAGGDATASSVISDVVDVLKGNLLDTFNTPVKNLKSVKILPISERVGKYYISGNINEVNSALNENNIKVLYSNDSGIIVDDVKEESIKSILSSVQHNLIRVEDC